MKDRPPSERLEGWFTDPFGRHEARWMSLGTPTSLVRDVDNESRDDPPDEPWSRDPERIIPVAGPSTRGADDVSRRMIDAAQTATIWTNQP